MSTGNFIMQMSSGFERDGSVPSIKSSLLACFFLCCAIAAPAEEVLVSTNLGDIAIQLNEVKAPVTVAHFLGLVDSGAYNNTIFHRVIPGFMVQAGGHYPDMTEALESETVINEADNGLSNDRGTVAMARMTEIDSASRQFFINLASNQSLNHHKKSCTRNYEATVEAARARGVHKPVTCKSFGYAVFGKVISGMDVVGQIEFTETKAVDGHDDVPVSVVIIHSVRRVH